MTSAPRRRPLGGYAPLVAAVAVLAAVVVAFPSTAPPEVEAAAVEAGTEGQPATGWGTTVEACPGGGPQVEGDPYSPPCFTFSGDNGGATSKGVTADTITVTYRRTADPNVLAVLATLLGIELDETPDDLQRTMEALVDHFNESFEMYGRRIELEVYEGKGSLVSELVGGGQEQAANDGLRVGSEIEAFADITATTQPYAEALAQQEVVAFGAPYMSREWFTDRRPYAWSFSSDCSVVAEIGSTYGLQRLIGRPAIYAGGDLEGRPRKLAVISPNNPEYQQCTQAGLAVVEEAGQEVDLVTDYVLDIPRIPNQAKSIAAQLISAGITTVSCFCDPFMLMNLGQAFDAQGLQPEWIVTGVGYGDLDLVGQGLDGKTDQWQRAFGLSPTAAQVPRAESAAYRAFEAQRPGEEPSLLVDVLYHQLYQLAMGIQMAGPDLTPESLETGLFSAPVVTGPAGTWDYFPGSYTPLVDVREVWWDPDLTSSFNDMPGSYASSQERIREDEITEGQPQVLGR